MLAQNFMTAEALKISEKERIALISVLGLLERGELRHSPVDEAAAEESKIAYSGLFNMVTFASPSAAECGTACCIAGTADVLFGTALCASWGNDELADLFYVNCEEDLNSITVPQAAAALRNFLTFGKPNWEEVLA